MARWFEPFRAAGLSDGQRDRLAAHAAYWGRVARKTDPLDRDRAMAAISRLYQRSRSGLKAPRFEWAASPLAGVLMAAEHAREAALSAAPSERRQVVSGLATREIEPDRSWFEHHRRRMGDEGWNSLTSGPRFVRELGMDGHVAIVRSIAAATDAAVRGRFDRWEFDHRDYVGGDSKRVARLDGAGRALYGEDWDFLAGYVGREKLVDRFDRQFRDFLSEGIDERIREMPGVGSRHFRGAPFDTLFTAAAMWGDALGRRSAHRDQIEPWLDVARESGPWWSFRDLAIVIDRPLVMRTDEQGRPHCDDGPAIAYTDGFEVWALHGVRVPEWLVKEPGRLDIAAIDAERNAEVRRVMAERFGAERLVREGDAELLDESEAGRLWRRRMHPEQRFRWAVPTEEHIVMVEVRNSTPEPDGSSRTYFLRVPPRMVTAQDAVAWTFGMQGAEYAPVQET